MGRIAVIVSPGARRSEIVGRDGDAWKVHVAAAPAGGRANEALVRLLADGLGIRPADVAVVAGRGSRRKFVQVASLEQEEIERRLDAFAR